MEGVPEKAIFRSVTVYNINSSSQCTLLAQIKQVQDNTYCLSNLISVSTFKCLLV